MKPRARFSLPLTLLFLSAFAALRLATPARAQDTTVTYSIANNATGVALNVPMVFTFSKAINTEESGVTFYQLAPAPGEIVVATSWGAGNTQLTCTPEAGNWPAETMVNWALSAIDVDGVEVTVPGPFPGVRLPPAGMFTTGTGGGTTDTDPPVLVLVSPTNNAAAVPLNRLIKFTFNESMQAAQSIQWSGNLTPAKFAYSWSTDARTLTCDYSENLPTNATVTWVLNPSGAGGLLKDTAGNALPEGLYSGSFVTSSTNDLCEVEPGDDGRGSFSLSWQASYLQTGSAAPAEDTNQPPYFVASLNSPTNNPVTSAQVDLPGGSSVQLQNLFGPTFLNLEEYATQAALDAARPAGTYTLRVNRSGGGSQSLTLSHQAADWPPTPHILNLPALQSVDANTDVVVQWNGFTGAGEFDSIFFSLHLNNDQVYYAPDPCVPIVLEKTATSITLPRGLLQAGKTYDALLVYNHFGPYNTNTIPDIVAFGGASKDVSFNIVASGGGITPRPPTLGELILTSEGLQCHITGAAPGQLIEVQESSTLLPGSWVTTRSLQADGSGTLNVVFPVAGTGAKFYQVRTP